MKKIIITISISIVLLLAVGLIFKQSIVEQVKTFLTADMFVTHDSDNFDPGLAIGQAFPLIDAQYNNVNVQSIEPFSGKNGTVFVVSRSLEWCPYCMKQMAQLNDNIEAFNQAGIALIGLSYDSVQSQSPFVDKFQIAYPIFSDNNAASVKNLGIFNNEYQVGDEAYGIGYPGAYIIAPNGIIVGKVFLQNYALRVDALSLLDYAQKVLQQ